MELRERIQQHGHESLSYRESLELVFGRDAAKVLKLYPDPTSLRRAYYDEALAQLGERLANRVFAALELCVKKETASIPQGTLIRSSRDLYNLFAPRMRELTIERVVVAFFDVKSRFLGERVISEGGPASCDANLRKLVATGIGLGASGMIIAHNHPSGDASPSEEDKALTKCLWSIGRSIDLNLVDHLIIPAGKSSYFSFLDSNIMPQ